MLSKKAILLATFGGLVMSLGFVTHNWTKISAWFPSLTISKAASAAGVHPLLSSAIATESRTSRLNELLKLPVSERSPAKFRGLQTTTEVSLKNDEWSRQIVIPSAKQNWWYIQVDPPDGYFIWFDDGSILETVPRKGIGDFGARPSTFRMLGKSDDQKATIKISNKPFKNP